MGIVQIEASSVWRSKFSAKMPGNKSRFYDKVILGEREREREREREIFTNNFSKEQ